MDVTYLGMLIFFACVVVGRMLSDRAFRKLPPEQKLALFDSFAGMRAYALLPVLAIFGAMFGIPYLFPGYSRLGLFIGMGMVLVYAAVMQVLSTRRLKNLNIDRACQQQFMLARLIGNLGLIVWFGLLLWQSLR